MYNQNSNNYMRQDLERFYPNIYRVVYPLVVTACRNVHMPLTEDMLSRMIDDICDKIDPVSLTNADAGNEFGRFNDPVSRPRNNRLLRDLTRILILRELLR